MARQQRLTKRNPMPEDEGRKAAVVRSKRKTKQTTVVAPHTLRDDQFSGFSQEVREWLFDSDYSE